MKKLIRWGIIQNRSRRKDPLMDCTNTTDVLSGTALPALQISDTDIDLIIKNYNRINPPETVDIAAAEQILTEQKCDGSFAGVPYDDDTRGHWLGMKHWDLLDTLVGAWHATRKNQYRTAVIAGLNFWGINLPENPNWWWQFVGVPYCIIRVLNNMYGEIPPETIANMRRCFDRSDIISMRNLYADNVKIDYNVLADRLALTEILRNQPNSPLAQECQVKFTGQNLVDTAIIRLWKGIYFKDTQQIFSGIEEAFSEVVFAGSRPIPHYDMPEVDRAWMSPGLEGIQADYSYHQHGAQQQFGNYGKAYFIHMMRFIELFDGTGIVPPPEKVDLIHKYFINGIRWTIYKKQFDILACGRELIKDMPWIKYARIAKTVAACKNTLQPELTAADKDLSGSNYFFRSDYLIHRRPNRFFSYKMCSRRVRGSESTNNENIKGLYLGCGVMQYKITGDEYDGMPALWDWRRLPGLTAVYDDAPLRAKADINASPFVGGVSDSINSGVMLNMFQKDKLEFYKSVATFEDAVVFTLSDIKNQTACPVNTTIDSKRCAAPVEVLFADEKVQSFNDGTFDLQQVSRIVCGETAYTFPEPVNITLVIEEKTVEWNTITLWTNGSFSGKSATFYLTGEKPASYIVHPANKSVAGIKSLIRENFYHAMLDEKSNIKYIFFFAPGEVEIPGIGKVSCDRKASVMITGNNILLAETEQNGSPVNFVLNGKEYKFAAPSGIYAGKSSIQPR